MHQFSKWLESLADKAATKTQRAKVRSARKNLPSDRDRQLRLLTACQTVLWQRESAGEDVPQKEYDQLRALRKELLGS